MRSIMKNGQIMGLVRGPHSASQRAGRCCAPLLPATTMMSSKIAVLVIFSVTILQYFNNTCDHSFLMPHTYLRNSHMKGLPPIIQILS